MSKTVAIPATQAQFILEPTQLTGLLKRANLEGAAYMLTEFQAGHLGEPRTWFDQGGAAAYIGIAEPTLCNYVMQGVGPKSCKIGNGRRFNRADLDAWILAGGIYSHKLPGKRGRPKQVADA